MSVQSVATDFLAMGGRIMLNPIGRLETGFDAGLIYGEGVSDVDAAERGKVVLAFAQVEHPHRRQLAALVARNGTATDDGWLVWKEGLK